MTDGRRESETLIMYRSTGPAAKIQVYMWAPVPVSLTEVFLA